LSLFQVAAPDARPRWYLDEDAAISQFNELDGDAVLYRIETFDLDADALVLAALNVKGLVRRRVPGLGKLSDDEPSF